MSTTLTSFKWGERTYIMGILNVTPDSFSGDGVMVEEDVIAKAVAQAKQFVCLRQCLQFHVSSCRIRCF